MIEQMSNISREMKILRKNQPKGKKEAYKVMNSLAV